MGVVWNSVQGVRAEARGRKPESGDPPSWALDQGADLHKVVVETHRASVFGGSTEESHTYSEFFLLANFASRKVSPVTIIGRCLLTN